MCDVLLESSLNVECNLGEFELVDVLAGTEKFIFPVVRCDTPG